MIYIIEGPDGAGKTTYAEFLSSVTGFPVRHFSNPKSEQEKAKMFDMYVEALEKNDNVIFDRSWISDMVYGPVLRGGATITPDQANMLGNMLAGKGGKVIYCTSDLRTLLERAYSRGEELIKPHQFVDIVNGYQMVFSDKSLFGEAAVIKHVS